MCGLFGVIGYKDDFDLVGDLGIKAQTRGSHATGISFSKEGVLYYLKDDVSATRFKFEGYSKSPIIMGHTRYATKGPAKDNYNNHPFPGEHNKDGVITLFTLSHNGMLNDDHIRAEHPELPTSKILTDSYVAVQLIESAETLNFDDAVKYMSENISGSYVLTIHTVNNLYVVKGSNPFHAVRNTTTGTVYYSSTDDLLFGALTDKLFIESMKSGDTHLKLLDDFVDGNIYKFNNNGDLETVTPFTKKAGVERERHNASQNTYVYNSLSTTQNTYVYNSKTPKINTKTSVPVSLKKDTKESEIYNKLGIRATIHGMTPDELKKCIEEDVHDTIVKLYAGG
jgi:predicted glutamine amidotransferase